MPLLRPVLVLVLVVTVIGSFQVFDTVAVTTGGGPVNATRVIQYVHLPKVPSPSRTSATPPPCPSFSSSSSPWWPSSR